jgi:carbonic anhydrase
LTDVRNSTTDELLAHAGRDPRPAGDDPVPSRGVTIVTCMDCRIDPYTLFGLKAGEVHLLRNAGGIVTEDVLRSLLLSQSLLETREVMVIQHTTCGLQAEEDELRRRVADAAGADPPWPLRAFTDVEASVRRQVAALRESPHLIETGAIRGFVYEVETGRLREVDGTS